MEVVVPSKRVNGVANVALIVVGVEERVGRVCHLTIAII